MAIPLEKLLSIPGNKYEFNVGAIRLVEKPGLSHIVDLPIDAWKIVPTTLEHLLDGKFHVGYREDFPEIEPKNATNDSTNEQNTDGVHTDAESIESKELKETLATHTANLQGTSPEATAADQSNVNDDDNDDDDDGEDDGLINDDDDDDDDEGLIDDDDDDNEDEGLIDEDDVIDDDTVQDENASNGNKAIFEENKTDPEN